VERRADELLGQGVSVLRTQRVLRREFPTLERDEAWFAAGLKLGRDMPSWFYNNRHLVGEARWRGPTGQK
jgi:hypothetical protein